MQRRLAMSQSRVILRDLVLPEYAPGSSKSSHMHHHRPAATHMHSPVLELLVDAHQYTAAGHQHCHHDAAHPCLLQTGVADHQQDHWQEHSYPLLHHMLLPKVSMEFMDYALTERKLDRH